MEVQSFPTDRILVVESILTVSQILDIADAPNICNLLAEERDQQGNLRLDLGDVILLRSDCKQFLSQLDMPLLKLVHILASLGVLKLE